MSSGTSVILEKAPKAASLWGPKRLPTLPGASSPNS
jgi:hypothetical protein